MKKEYKNFGGVKEEVVDTQIKYEEESLLLQAYAAIPLTDGGCGSDGGSDGGPPYC